MKKLTLSLCLVLSICLMSAQLYARDGVLKHHYTFDENWTSQVLDSVGGKNGAVSSLSNVTRVDETALGNLSDTCYSAQFTGGVIELNNLKVKTGNKKKNSVSYWMKWYGADNQMPLSWAKYDLWLRNSKFGFNSWVSNVYGINSSAVNNKWVHVAAVFNNNKMQLNKLYIDGVEQSLFSNSDVSNSNNTYATKQMSIGGHLSGSTPDFLFNGLIDDFKIYTGEISQAQVTADMVNTGVTCQSVAITPTVEYRFDNAHTFATNDILDSSGSNNHGTAFVASSSDGLLCDAVDFTTTESSDYILANNNALNGLSDFTAMAWIKTNQTSDATIFSAAASGSALGANEAVFFIRNTNQFWPTITASPFNTSTQLSGTQPINDNQWHQVVWTRNAATKQSCFFVDGVAQGCVTHNDGDDTSPINVVTGGLILGQEQDSLGGDFESNQAFNGLMDEFIIFSRILDTATISGIDQNIRTQKNWDGTPRVCSVVTPVDNLIDFNDDGARVVQIIGNSNNTNPWNANLNDNPAGNWKPQGSLYSQSQIDSYFSVKDNKNSGATWYNFGTSDDYGILVIDAQRALDISTIAASNMDSDGQATHLRVFAYQGAIPADIQIPANVLSPSNSDDSPAHNATGWVEVLAKSPITQNTLTSNSIEMTTYPLVNTQTARWWKVYVYNDGSGSPSSPSYTELRSIKLFGVESSNSIDHYRFEIPTTGLTCLASDVVLKACEDGSCSQTSSLTASLTLSPSGLWSGTDVTGNNVSFNSGLTSLKLSQPVAGTTLISASSLSPAPSSATPVQCFNGSTAVSCSVLFKDSGFLFSNIPHQISNKPSSVEFNGQTLSIQAVEKNTTTGACQAIFPNGDDINIELKLNCVSGSCSNIAVTTGSSVIPVQVSSSFSNVPFNFGANSEASYEFNYANAGELSLSAKKVVTLDSGATETLEGISNNFVVKPFGFRFEFPNDADPFSDGLPAGDFTVFKKAGENFAVSAVAIGWQALGEDVNNDGNIDVGENANDNPTVQFFNGELVKLTHDLQLPTGGSPGIFTATNATTASSTAAFTNANWNEVGVISLTATLDSGSYLTAGNVSGTVGNIGRFTPDHFNVSNIVAGNLTGQCAAVTFIGELTPTNTGALKYGINPMMTITAQSSANTSNSTTVNYRGLFERLTTSTSPVIFTPPINDAANNLAMVSALNSGGITGGNGVFTYMASSDDNFVYTRNASAQIAQFPSNLAFVASQLQDADNVAVDVLPTLTATSQAGHMMYYGRVHLKNAFGPESDMLAMPMEHQYFDGNKFIVNPNIGTACPYVVTPNVDFTLTPTSLGSLNQAALVTPVIWASGRANLFIPPPLSATGSVEFTLSVPSWLKYNWDNIIVSPDTDPATIATFGRYRGNDRIINWREKR